ncbi:DNA (cytosine-5-)-methyltransferase [Dehalobacter sp. TBBPA1]|uniref:DNA (cytosine-5-)-methyltransferase n=1 Tax=Dehalobacter sp. TBBPA1 TaxID=3235037 RepID=UPI0034A21FA9
MKKKYKVGSLFAGVGGICLGFMQAENSEAEYEVVWANEIDEYASETYRTNFKHNLIEGDIELVLKPELVQVRIDHIKAQLKSIDDISKIKLELNNLIAEINNSPQLNEEMTASFTDLSKDICEKSEQLKSISKFENHVEEVLQINSKIESVTDKGQLLKLISNMIELADKLTSKTEKKDIERLLAKYQDQLSAKYYEQMHDRILEEEIDVLNGGFPCQAFSIAGEQKGFEDERGNLFLSIIELIKQLGERHRKPRLLFLENVKNLGSHDNGRTYAVIKRELEKTGYTVYESVLNTMSYSYLPQNRERIYIVGFLNESDANRFQLFENISKFKTVKSSEERMMDIKKIIDYDTPQDDKYYYTKEKYPHYFVTEEEYATQTHSKKDVRINLEEDVNEMYQFYQVRRGQYVRKNQSDVCPTLTANMGTGGHNVPLVKVENGIRKLTPKESFKLQGFPVGNGYVLPEKYKNKNYADSNLYKQAGNAVSVPVIRFLAEELLKVLASDESIDESDLEKKTDAVIS